MGRGGAGQGRAWLLASNSAKSVLLCFISLHYLWQLINAAGTFECNEDDCKQGYTNWRANYGCFCMKVTMYFSGCVVVFQGTLSHHGCIRIKVKRNFSGYVVVFQAILSNHCCICITVTMHISGCVCVSKQHCQTMVVLVYSHYAFIKMYSYIQGNISLSYYHDVADFPLCSFIFLKSF